MRDLVVPLGGRAYHTLHSRTGVRLRRRRETDPTGPLLVATGLDRPAARWEAEFLLAANPGVTTIRGKSLGGRFDVDGIHLEESLQRQGVGCSLLLRLQALISDGMPCTVSGGVTEAGWGLAQHMHREHGWLLCAHPMKPPPA